MSKGHYNRVITGCWANMEQGGGNPLKELTKLITSLRPWWSKLEGRMEMLHITEQ